MWLCTSLTGSYKYEREDRHSSGWGWFVDCVKKKSIFFLFENKSRCNLRKRTNDFFYSMFETFRVKKYNPYVASFQTWTVGNWFRNLFNVSVFLILSKNILPSVCHEWTLEVLLKKAFPESIANTSQSLNRLQHNMPILIPKTSIDTLDSGILNSKYFCITVR